MSMGQSQQEAYRSVGRGNVLFFNPDQLTLIEDAKHPLYDPSVDLPIDHAMVDSIVEHGVIEPIVVRLAGRTKKGEPIIEVVDGRQRVKNAAEANRRLEAAGKEEVLVPAIARRGEDADLFGVMASTLIRRREDPVEQARKIAKLIAMGRTEVQAAASFGMSRTALRLRLALLEASKVVQDAVRAETISIDDGGKIAKLPRDEQEAALEKSIAAKPGKARKRQVREEIGEKRPRMLGRTKVVKLAAKLDHTSGVDLAYVRLAVHWILGDLSEDDAKAFERGLEL
jgi:ParB family chromosome partitioning protein